jgi:hypothetical protein
MFAEVCPALTGCLALDPASALRPRDEIFLNDGHWAAGGHRLAAARIGDWLLTLDPIGPRLEPEAGAANIARSDPCSRARGAPALDRRPAAVQDRPPVRLAGERSA